MGQRLQEETLREALGNEAYEYIAVLGEDRDFRFADEGTYWHSIKTGIADAIVFCAKAEGLDEEAAGYLVTLVKAAFIHGRRSMGQEPANAW